MVYYFFLIIGVFVVVASDTIQTYHVAVVGYLACGLVLTTSSVNGLVYSANGAKEAASAGFILLSMVTVCYTRSVLVLAGPRSSPIWLVYLLPESCL